MARSPASQLGLGLMGYQQILDEWEKCSDDCRKLLATQAGLLKVCKEAVAMDANACCDTEPWLATDIRNRMVAAIAEAEGEKP